MPFAITISESQARNNILLALNIIGVIACLCTNTLLVLIALGVILQEPDISPVMAEHVRYFYNRTFHLKTLDWRLTPIEDSYLFYLNHLDVLIMSSSIK
ncbi:hypothetical protein SFRURICE_004653 [Spodoptera frugiperda]|uniref:SFRICE_028689 n=1 Tax=Spodoptera frugiperda TaxID=7108 RepID=A0A2H1WT75_SPOFR|nr:hypothetical protein SFRURICE_004653 [Spodoptera frugiperda]